MTHESIFQSRLKATIESMFPGCMILKNDSNYLQGIPDLIILYRDKWAMLEVKKSEHAPHQPNQDYYIQLLGEMSYAAFVYPSNEEEILRGLQKAFEPRRNPRVSQRK